MRPFLLLASFALLLAGCTAPSAERQLPVQETSMALGPTEAFRPGPYEFTTTIQETGYQHVRLDAFVDGTITWWNVDGRTHAVYSDDGMFASSGPIAPGSEFTYTFLTPGDYAYHCPFHPDMKGLVVVR